MAGTWEGLFRSLLAEKGYVAESISHDPAYGWTISYSYGGVLAGTGEFEADTTVKVQQMIALLPLCVHPDAEEVMWTARMPLVAAAKVGKVHTRNPGAHETLCGLKVGPARMQFTVTARDPRCTRCAAKKRTA